MRALTGAATKMNAENFVAVGFVFWLLLDLIQGAYDLRDASDEALQLALIAIGLSSAAMWLGRGRPALAPAARARRTGAARRSTAGPSGGWSRSVSCSAC